MLLASSRSLSRLGLAVICATALVSASACTQEFHIPEPVIEGAAQPASSPSDESVAQPEPEVQPEPEPTEEPDPEPEPTPEPDITEPTPDPEPEPDPVEDVEDPEPEPIECGPTEELNEAGTACVPLCGPGFHLNLAQDECFIDCPDGSVNNNTLDGCIPIDPGGEGGEEGGSTSGPVICPDGYIPAGGGGEADVCVPIVPVTVHGFVTDAANGDPVEDATITLYPLVDEFLLSDEAGYFSYEEFPYTGTVNAVYEADGYFTAIQTLEVPLVGGDATKIHLVDASRALVPVPGPEVPPQGDFFIAGTVYTPLGPAEAAEVFLFDNTVGSDVATTTCDSDGAFLLDGLLDDGHTFTLRISSYDADQDEVFDYAYKEVALGSLSKPLSGKNLSNLVVVLSAIEKAILFGNFVPTVTNINGGGLYKDYAFQNPNADIILHFGSEADAATLNVELWSILDGNVDEQVSVNAFFNLKGTILTVDPISALVQDADPKTEYELRINALLWADGTAFVPLDAGAAGAMKLRFDVGTAPTYLPNPEPSISTDDLADDNQTVATVSCDSRVCWLLDAFGYPFGGPVATEAGGTHEAFYNAASGLILEWTSVQGAANYKIYARQGYEGTLGEPIIGWTEVGATIDAGFVDPDQAQTVTATGVLGSGAVTWGDLGIGGGNPLAFANHIEIAVTSVSALGIETPIDADLAVVLADGMRPRIEAVSVVSGGTAPQDEDNETGHRDVQKVFDVTFSEITNGADIAWSIHSGSVFGLWSDGQDPIFSDPLQGHSVKTTWESGDVVDSEGVSDLGRAGRLHFDFDGPCVTVTADADGDTDTVQVSDTRIFEDPDASIVFFINPQVTSLIFPTIKSIEQVDPENQTLDFETTLEADGGSSVPAGSLACLQVALEGQSSASTTTTTAGSTTISVSDSALFHPLQKVVIISQSASNTLSGPYVMEVVRLRQAGPNPIFQPAQLDIRQPGTSNSGLSQTVENALVFPWPDPNELDFRHAAELELSGGVNFNPADDAELALTQASMEASRVLEGDLMLVDMDGELLTVADQLVVEVGAVEMTPSQGEFYIVVEQGPTGDMIPAGSLIPDELRILHLADHFTLSSLGDTSGNFGLDPHGDQFSFCSGGDWCKGGLFVH